MYYLLPSETSSGAIVAEIDNPAVSSDLLREIYSWKEEGCRLTDILVRLRPRTVPSGHEFHTRTIGNNNGIAKYVLVLTFTFR